MSDNPAPAPAAPAAPPPAAPVAAASPAPSQPTAKPSDAEILRRDIKSMVDDAVAAALADRISTASGALAPTAAGTQASGERPVRPAVSNDLVALTDYVDALDAYRHGGA